MPTRLVQFDHQPAGTASLQISGASVQRLAESQDLQIAIAGVGSAYLDPRNPEQPWSPSVFRFRPLAQRLEGELLQIDIDHGVTCHLRANQPYALFVRGKDGVEVEERFTGTGAIRRPSGLPRDWMPPPEPMTSLPSAAITVQKPGVSAAAEAPAQTTTIQTVPAPVQMPEAVLMASPPADAAQPIAEQEAVPTQVAAQFPFASSTSAPRSGGGNGLARRLGLLCLVLLLAGALWYLFGNGVRQPVAPAAPAVNTPVQTLPPPAPGAVRPSPPASIDMNCSETDEKAGLCRRNR